MDTPTDQAPATRSEWLALMREAVRDALDEQQKWRVQREAEATLMRAAILRDVNAALAPQPPSEG